MGSKKSKKKSEKKSKKNKSSAATSSTSAKADDDMDEQENGDQQTSVAVAEAGEQIVTQVSVKSLDESGDESSKLPDSKKEKQSSASEGEISGSTPTPDEQPPLPPS